MSILNSVEIAGICGKFARPENQKEGLHLLAEMASEAQHAKDKAESEQKVGEIFGVVERVKNPYKKLTAEEASKTPAEMCELETGFEDARQAILEALRKEGEDAK